MLEIGRSLYRSLEQYILRKCTETPALDSVWVSRPGLGLVGEVDRFFHLDWMGKVGTVKDKYSACSK